MTEVLEVAYNYNADLIHQLQDEELLPDYPIEERCIGDYIGSCFYVYEGKNNWFVLVDTDVRDNQDEVIVPKKVSPETALKIAMLVALKDECDIQKDLCEENYDSYRNYCKINYESCIEHFPDLDCKSEYNECLLEAEEDYRDCNELIDNSLCKPSHEVELFLRKLGIREITCTEGAKVGSPDIDQICYFEITQ